MTYEEAIELINDVPTVILKPICSTYEYNRALNLAEKAMLKEIKKKPLPVRDVRSGRVVTYQCPCCQKTYLGQNEYRFDCCEYCGQALDWSDA